MNLTNKQKDMLLDLILTERERLGKLTATAQICLKDYKSELATIYQVICDSLESEEE